MRRFCSLLPFAALLIPACAIYDQALLDSARGVDDPGAGGTQNTGGGSPTAGGSGGLDSTGGASVGGTTPATTGGTGGTSGTGGSMPTGGSGGDGSGGIGAGGGSGGTEACDPAVGTKGDFTGIVSSKIFDPFNVSLPDINGGDEYSGNWTMNNDGEGTGARPRLPLPDWVYDQDPCLSPGDTSLHVMGSDYTVYGIGYDAKILLSGNGVDLSAHTGVTFWARSAKSNMLRASLSDSDGDPPFQFGTRTITGAWKEYKFVFPMSSQVDLTDVAVLHLVIGVNLGAADDELDIWIDDLSFYTE